ncbi:unnamed protein product [Closterium sp. NIES-65]|nr:unnamed protein product [Closterium sp. NIES-65]
MSPLAYRRVIREDVCALAEGRLIGELTTAGHEIPPGNEIRKPPELEVIGDEVEDREWRAEIAERMHRLEVRNESQAVAIAKLERQLRALMLSRTPQPGIGVVDTREGHGDVRGDAAGEGHVDVGGDATGEGHGDAGGDAVGEGHGDVGGNNAGTHDSMRGAHGEGPVADVETGVGGNNSKLEKDGDGDMADGARRDNEEVGVRDEGAKGLRRYEPFRLSARGGTNQPMAYGDDDDYDRAAGAGVPMGSWTTGCCACADDCAGALCACMCPCVVVGRIAEVVTDGYTDACVAACLFCCMQLCSLGALGCCYSHLFRARLRHNYMLPAEPCPDCCVHALCLCCALAQEHRELRNRGWDPRLGFHENHEQQPSLAPWAAPPPPARSCPPLTALQLLCRPSRAGDGQKGREVEEEARGRHVGVWIEPSGETAVCVDGDTYAPLATFTAEPGSGSRVWSGCCVVLLPLACTPHRSVTPPDGAPVPPSSTRYVSSASCLRPPACLAVTAAFACTAVRSLRRGSAARHPSLSSLRPATEPFETLHLDVWGPAPRLGPERERFFLVVIDDYSRYTTVFPLAEKSERNLRPRVSWLEALPTSLWTGSPGVASRFRVWGCLALVRDTSADKLSPRAVPFVFLGFPEDSSDFTFYHPPSHRFFDSRDVRFEESTPYYVRCSLLPRSPPRSLLQALWEPVLVERALQVLALGVLELELSSWLQETLVFRELVLVLLTLGGATSGGVGILFGSW